MTKIRRGWRKKDYERRQEEARKRQNHRDNRSDEAQLRHLENAGHGDCKEARNLRASLIKKEGGKKNTPDSKREAREVAKRRKEKLGIDN